MEDDATICPVNEDDATLLHKMALDIPPTEEERAECIRAEVALEAALNSERPAYLSAINEGWHFYTVTHDSEGEVAVFDSPPWSPVSLRPPTTQQMGSGSGAPPLSPRVPSSALPSIYTELLYNVNEAEASRLERGGTNHFVSLEEARESLRDRAREAANWERSLVQLHVQHRLDMFNYVNSSDDSENYVNEIQHLLPGDEGAPKYVEQASPEEIASATLEEDAATLDSPSYSPLPSPSYSPLPSPPPARSQAWGGGPGWGGWGDYCEHAVISSLSPPGTQWGAAFPYHGGGWGTAPPVAPLEHYGHR